MAGANKEASRDILSSSPSSSELSNCSLDDLQELLIEVLLRLPTFKYAFQCKCVSKNWYSLISTPYFVRRFITHHSNHHHEHNPSALIMSYWTKGDDFGLFTISDEPIFKSPGFDLSYLFCDHDEHIGRIKVSAIYKDLMLCSEFRKDDVFRFHVCNPFTKQSVSLPLLEVEKDTSATTVGFICEPYDSEDGQGECTLNSEYRFRVVVQRDEYQRFIFWTFCSETCEWDRSVLHNKNNGWTIEVVAYNGKLLWCSGFGLFAYDPFNPELSSFIDLSVIKPRELLYFGDYCVAVCKGFVRIMVLVFCGTRRSLAIWELKDYATKEWSLEGKVYLDTMITEPSLEGNLRPLGFHSSDRDVVYLYHGRSVFSCNMITKELKIVGEVPCGGRFYKIRNVFNIELPLWPTPIHKPIEFRP